MEIVGTFALRLAVTACGLGALLSLRARKQGDPAMLALAVQTAKLAAALTILAACSLFCGVMLDDFHIKVIQKSSSRDLDLGYRISLLWISLQSSLLFWAALQAAFLWMSLSSAERHAPRLLPVTSATLLAVLGFFLYLVLMHHNPLDGYMVERPWHGAGMKPMLRNFWMLIHPPAQYLGYVAASVPFAFTVAALLGGPEGKSASVGALDAAWVRVARPWIMFTWLLCGVGLVLGMIWAYEEVDWGGYWTWDPVENASLLPFLTATIAVHSLSVYRRRRLFGGWTVFALFSTFWLTIIGTFFTRSGVIQSIHSFGEDSALAWAFLVFIVAGGAASFTLLSLRTGRLAPLESTKRLRPTQGRFWTSRAAAFLLCNWLLLLSMLFVLTASIAPAVSELVSGHKLALRPSFYEQWMVPMGLAALAVLGLGQVLPQEGFDSAGRALRGLAAPAAGFLVGVLWAFLGPLEGAGAGSVLACGFAFMTAAGAFQQQAALFRRSRSGVRRLTSTLVHLGVAMIFVGFAGRSLQKARQVKLSPGESVEVGDVTVTYLGFGRRMKLESDILRAELNMDLRGRPFGVLRPALEIFTEHPVMPASMTSLKRGLGTEVQARLRAAYTDGSAVIQVISHPLSMWIWLGFAILVLGGLIQLRIRRILGSIIRPASRDLVTPQRIHAGLLPRPPGWLLPLLSLLWAFGVYVVILLRTSLSPVSARSVLAAAGSLALPAAAFCACRFAWQAAALLSARKEKARS